MRMPFGQYEGWEVDEIPLSYLRWLQTIDLYGNLADAVDDAVDEHEAHEGRYTAQPFFTPLPPPPPAAVPEAEPRYWQADDHQWGPGKSHIIRKGGEKLLCGKLVACCPGRPIMAPADGPTCGACIQALERWDRWQQQQGQ